MIISTGDYDDFTLRKYADLIKDDLSNLTGVSKISIDGGDIAEVEIAYYPEKLASYGLTVGQANSIIAANNVRIPVGHLDISNYRYAIRVDSRFKSVKDIRNFTLVSMNGQMIRLRDVANVFERARNTDIINKFSSQGGSLNNSITISVVKKTGSSIIDIIDDGKLKIEKLQFSALPKDLDIESTLDLSKKIRDDINGLIMSGLETLLLVVFILLIFVGVKESLIASLIIPLVFAATFGIMFIIGMTINFLSLFALILSLGMLVDNAIVVLQASKQYIRTGKFTPEEALLLVFKDFKYILLTTTLTTVWAFIPLVFASGIMGLFIRSIPITVSATLLASLVVAFVVNHPLSVFLERWLFTRNQYKTLLFIISFVDVFFLFKSFLGGFNFINFIIFLVLFFIVLFLFIYYKNGFSKVLKENEKTLILELAYDDKVKERILNKYLNEEKNNSLRHKLFTGIVKLDYITYLYEGFLSRILNNKFLSILVIVFTLLAFVFSLFLPMFGVLKTELLPPSDSVYMYVNVEVSNGALLATTYDVSEKVANILRKIKEIKNFSLTVGSNGVQKGNLKSISTNNTNKAQFALILYDYGDRPINENIGRTKKSYEIANLIRNEVDSIKEGKVTVTEASNGPPSGADFEARIVGPDLLKLEELANSYKNVVSEFDGTINESISIQNNPGEFVVHLDYDKLALHGIAAGQVGQALRVAINGAKVTTLYKESKDDVDIMANFKGFDKKSMSDVENIPLQNGRGQIFLLKDVASVSLDSSFEAISHLDQDRIAVIYAAVEQPKLPSEILDEFKSYVEKHPLPNDYKFIYGGVNKETQNSILSILQAMVISFLLIVLTLIIEFNSIKKTFIVLVTIPLATTGVFFGIWAIGLNLSFPVLIGLLSLFGIVVNNAITLVDKIGINFNFGLSFFDSILDAAKSRLEAIFLTSVATIMGVLPLVFYSETWMGLSLTLIFGLLSSTFLTLVLVPVLYKLLLEGDAKKEEVVRKLKEV